MSTVPLKGFLFVTANTTCGCYGYPQNCPIFCIGGGCGSQYCLLIDVLGTLETPSISVHVGGCYRQYCLWMFRGHRKPVQFRYMGEDVTATAVVNWMDSIFSVKVIFEYITHIVGT